MEVRCYSSLDEVASIQEELNALNRVSARPDPFSTFEFFQNYAQHDEDFLPGNALRLWFLAAFLDGRLVGYLPLKQVSRRTMAWRTVKLDCFITHDTDRPHLVARREHLLPVSVAFYAYLLGRKREWSFLEFQQQDGSSPLFPPPTVVNLKSHWSREWPSMENGTIHIRWGTLIDYYNALSKKFRSNVSRQMRSLLAAGEVAWLSSSDPSVTPALFELYCSIEPHSWKSQADATIGRHPERIEYVRGLLGAQQPMRISIQILLLDGTPVAGLINGSFMNGLYALHIVYDNRLQQLAPGSAMLLMGMRQAIEGRYAFYNLLSGFGYYKVRWLAEITQTRSAQIYRVGKLMFWRRVFGDWRRWIFSSSTKKAALTFNPARREVVENEAVRENIGAIAVSARSFEERQRNAVLIAQIKSGQGEFLLPTELAALMPFAVKQAARTQGKTPMALT